MDHFLSAKTESTPCSLYLIFFLKTKKRANPGLFFVYFRSFHIPIQMTNILYI